MHIKIIIDLDQTWLLLLRLIHREWITERRQRLFRSRCHAAYYRSYARERRAWNTRQRVMPLRDWIPELVDPALLPAI